MEKTYILTIDQGTSSTKTLIFDDQGNALAKGSVPLHTHYFGAGWVEQDPEDIYQNVLSSVKACLDDFVSKGGNTRQIVTCGISNQRETFLLWDETGAPLYPAVVWQCKRSVQVCDDLKAAGLHNKILQRTGLIIDPYFSGSKLIWLFQNNASVKAAIDSGKARFGTVDTWLLYRLTGGAAYKTDYTNASRTLLFNLNELNWDAYLLQKFGLEKLRLPQVQASSSDFGASDFEGLLAQALPIQSMIGDSHAAAFGEGCFESGTAKATLGTGCSILMNVGDTLKPAAKGMVSTICWSTENEVAYAQEGVIVSCGSVIEWMRKELGLLHSAKEAEEMAFNAGSNGGVYIVPAFSGLGAPYWDMNRKAEIYGLTFSNNKNHLVRAALETIAYQINDVLTAMEQESGIRLTEIRLNGGITNNAFVMQSLANLLSQSVYRMQQPDISALGAALLAGLKAKVFDDITSLGRVLNHQQVLPDGDESIKDSYNTWKGFVAKC